mgnify:CR=1 FL=1
MKNLKLSETRKRLFSEGKLKPNIPHFTQRGLARLSELGKSRIGAKNPYYGRKHTEITKAIIAQKNRARIGKARGGKTKGHASWCKGLELVPRPIKICQWCGNGFKAKNKKQKFCCVTHASQYNAKQYLAKYAGWNKGKIFSEKTRAKIAAKANGRKGWSVETRRKVGETIRRLYAEGKMVHADVSLEKNPNWKGGIKYLPYHYNFNYTARRLVRERDNYTCALCNQHGSLVHHINGDKQNPEARLITLCFRCHGIAERNSEKYRPMLNEIFERRWVLSEF